MSKAQEMLSMIEELIDITARAEKLAKEIDNVNEGISEEEAKELMLQNPELMLKMLSLLADSIGD